MHVVSSRQRVAEMEAFSLYDSGPGDLRVGRVLQVLGLVLACAGVSSSISP